MTSGERLTTPTITKHGSISGGITIREYFASIAMQSIIQGVLSSKDITIGYVDNELMDRFSKLAVSQADSLIRALNKYK